MADEQDKPTGFKPKFWPKAVLTNDGRHAFLQSVASNHVLHYTRVTLSSQKMVDGQGKMLDNEAISNLTGLSDDLKEGTVQLTPVVDNHFAVTADFDNKNVPDDIEFSSIGWYGRIDTVDPNDHDNVLAQGKEVLIAILPTTKDHEILAAGSLDQRSTQVISAQLDFTISDAANINMTVNEIGYVTRAELNSWEVDMEGKIKNADLSKLKFRKQMLDNNGYLQDKTWSATRNSDGTYTINLFDDDWTASKLYSVIEQVNGLSSSKADKTQVQDAKNAVQSNLEEAKNNLNGAISNLNNGKLNFKNVSDGYDLLSDDSFWGVIEVN
ncbi:hypothetical protein, partial [Lactobacillus xujianguonis]